MSDNKQIFTPKDALIRLLPDVKVEYIENRLVPEMPIKCIVSESEYMRKFARKFDPSQKERNRRVIFESARHSEDKCWHEALRIIMLKLQAHETKIKKRN